MKKILTKPLFADIITDILLNALTELLFPFQGFRESAFGASRYPYGVQASFPSRTAEIVMVVVSGYGAPRYHGEKLVGVLFE